MKLCSARRNEVLSEERLFFLREPYTTARANFANAVYTLLFAARGLANASVFSLHPTANQNQFTSQGLVGEAGGKRGAGQLGVCAIGRLSNWATVRPADWVAGRVRNRPIEQWHSGIGHSPLAG